MNSEYDPIATLEACQEFSCARQEMLTKFRCLIAASPDVAVREAEATLSAMRQLFQLELAQ